MKISFAIMIILMMGTSAFAADWARRASLPDAPWAIASLAFSPDGKTLAVGSGKMPASSIPFGKGKVEIRDAATLKLITTISNGPSAFDLKFLDNDLLAIGSMRLEILDIHSGKRKGLLADYGREFTLRYDSLTLSSDRKGIAAAGHVWDIASHKQLPDVVDAELTFRDDGMPNDAFTISPEGSFIAAATVNEKLDGFHIRVWDRHTGKELASTDLNIGQLIRPVLCFSPDGSTLLCNDGPHDSKTLERKFGFGNKDGLGGFMPDGSAYYRAIDDQIHFYNVQNNKPADASEIDEHHPITCVAITSDCKTVAVGWDDDHAGRCGVDIYDRVP